MKMKWVYFMALGAVASTLASTGVSAQQTWHNPMDADFPTVQNQGFVDEIGNSYARLPQRAEAVVRKPVWDLSRNSAGLAVDFVTDATRINVRYVCSNKNYSMPHMPATGVSGVDLYRTSPDGDWQRCWGGYAWGDTISYWFTSTPGGEDKSYRLYLPTYNSVEWLEVGTPEGSSFNFLPRNEEKPIVVYGTSITQGACASRSSMGWTSILSRSLGVPLVNLGFSGNGRLEPEVIDFVNEVDGRLYIVDCLPNLLGKSSDEIVALATAAVKQIRSKHPDTPILLTEHIGNSSTATDQHRRDDVANLNRGLRQAFETLQAEGVGNIAYLTQGEINMLTDDWVDYIHPSDLGMAKQAGVVKAKLLEAFPGAF